MRNPGSKVVLYIVVLYEMSSICGTAAANEFGFNVTYEGCYQVSDPLTHNMGYMNVSQCTKNCTESSFIYMLLLKVHSNTACYCSSSIKGAVDRQQHCESCPQTNNDSWCGESAGIYGVYNISAWVATEDEPPSTVSDISTGYSYKNDPNKVFIWVITSILFILLIVLSMAIIIYCKKRQKKKNRNPLQPMDQESHVVSHIHNQEKSVHEISTNNLPTVQKSMKTEESNQRSNTTENSNQNSEMTEVLESQTVQESNNSNRPESNSDPSHVINVSPVNTDEQKIHSTSTSSRRRRFGDGASKKRKPGRE